ncbi:Hsp70 family protein [Bacillus cereus]|uniref:Hsp70 family protein n=1 Tax=Bacillus cereus TaxID=1396 RepID=UPI002AC1976D|nr:Hsp70 family protein [Bacillus cereus]MDZ4621178.1 Hsp70 family protein [Bacillus cereus]
MFFGIDLGTTNSTISYWVKTGEDSFDVKTIRNSNGHPLTPSVVFFEEGTKKSIIGKNALDSFDFFPDRTIRWVKRDMGNLITYEIDDKEYNPSMISAMILKDLKNRAEKDLQVKDGDLLKDIVITVPADFDVNAKHATIDAAKIAGFENISLIAEPNAAVLNYIFRTKETGKLFKKFSQEEKFYVVFDLGGGTFDISLSAISLDQENKPKTRVISSSGEKYLGGINFDIDLMTYVLEKAKRIHHKHKESENIDLLIEHAKEYFEVNTKVDENIRNTLARIIKECENGKIALSEEQKRYFTFMNYTGKTFRIEIHRQEFEDLIQPYLNRMENHVQNVLSNAIKSTNNKISTWEDIDGVLLVGGSTNIPIIQNFCRQIFGDKIIDGIDTYESVAKGAALYSAMKNSSESLLGEYSVIVPHDYGLLIENNFEVLLNQGTDTRHTKYMYRIPFSLDVQSPIIIAQRYHNNNGEEDILEIEKINYSHPFIYTGDQLEVTFEMDDNLMLFAKVKEACIDDSMEIVIENNLKLSEEEILVAKEWI